MKLFILLIIAGIGCSTTSNTSKQVAEFNNLKSKYDNLIIEIDTKGQSLDRNELKAKQKEARELESKMKQVEKEIDEVIIDLTYQKSFEKNSVTSAPFRIKKISQIDENLEVNLQYAGCGGPHQFELITNGDVDENGIVDLHLIDKTLGDNCKMLIMKTKKFNIAKINKKAKITGFRINGSKEISLSKSK